MSRWQVIEHLGSVWDDWVGLCPNADVYHLSGYVSAMNVDPSALPRLLVYESEQGVVVHPLLLRPLDTFGGRCTGLFDAITCYGYGGPAWAARGADSRDALLAEFWRDQAWVLRDMGVLCQFVRLHPLIPAHKPLLGASCLVNRGPTVAIDLAPSPAELLARLSTNHRRNIAKAQQLGVQVSLSSRPQALDDFCSLYALTMDRVGARPEYYFARSSLAGLFALPEGSAWLGTARLDGKIVAASLYLCNGPSWHYHLGASDEAARQSGANHLLMFESALFAKTLGKMQMHLGGGHGCQEDSLLRFKSGFGGHRCTFRTVQEVFHPEPYHALCAEVGVEPACTAFFPAYRDVSAPARLTTLAHAGIGVEA